MTSKVTFAAMTAVEVAAVATLAACGGGGAGADATNGTDMTAQRVHSSTSSTVTLTVSAQLGGSVQSDPYGLISCTSAPQSSTCVATVPVGHPIALTEGTLPGYVSKGWSGSGCSGTAAPCTT